tara:strand:+ start:227 stop:355 length:129 start_codon:yes stop_codon:yes gene_type:complete
MMEFLLGFVFGVVFVTAVYHRAFTDLTVEEFKELQDEFTEER